MSTENHVVLNDPAVQAAISSAVKSASLDIYAILESLKQERENVSPVVTEKQEQVAPASVVEETKPEESVEPVNEEKNEELVIEQKDEAVLAAISTAVAGKVVDIHGIVDKVVADKKISDERIAAEKKAAEEEAARVAEEE
ncbi:hypothetical protein K492DRAFT_194294, partial [Lichtheimia hyalospora FSU 10163]